MRTKIYEPKKIDNLGRILLPKQLRDHLKKAGVKHIWIEQNMDENTHTLRWKNGE